MAINIIEIGQVFPELWSKWSLWYFYLIRTHKLLYLFFWMSFLHLELIIFCGQEHPVTYSVLLWLASFPISFVLFTNYSALLYFFFFFISNPMCESDLLFALNSDTLVLICTLLLYANSTIANQSGHCSWW